MKTFDIKQYYYYYYYYYHYYYASTYDKLIVAFIDVFMQYQRAD